MTVVVTGAAGHVGGNLVRALLAAGRPVRAVVHQDRRALAGLDVEIVSADVLDPAQLKRAFAGAEVVYHLAAIVSISGDLGGRVTATNVDGVRHAAAAALACGVRRFVHFSSIHAFDLERDDAVITEQSPRPNAGHPAYDRAKYAGEQAVREAIAAGLDAVIVNPTAVVGPHDYRPSHVGQLLVDLPHRRLPSLVAGGFDWVDVRDVVAGALAAEQRGRTGENYLLTGHYHSLVEIAAWVGEITGVAPPRLVAPIWLAWIGAPFVRVGNWVMRTRPLYTAESLRALLHADRIAGDKARRELGYQARPLRQTIEDTLKWFAQQGRIELR